MVFVVVKNQQVAKSRAAALGAGGPEGLQVACSQVWRSIQGQVRLESQEEGIMLYLKGCWAGGSIKPGQVYKIS